MRQPFRSLGHIGAVPGTFGLMSLVGVRTWASQHALAFALLVWVIPVVVLAPVASLVAQQLIAVPIDLAAPVVPAAAAYAANRSHG